MLESPQALIVAGLAVLITVSIVKWKTHPVSGVLWQFGRLFLR